MAASGTTDSQRLASQLARARLATAKYATSLRAAKADGYQIIIRMISMAVRGQDGTGTLEQALRIELDAGLQEAADRTYSSLQEAAARSHKFEEAERYYAAGMAYCEDSELGTFSMCLLGWRACALLLVGRWDEAAEVCTRMPGAHGISPVNRINRCGSWARSAGAAAKPGRGTCWTRRSRWPRRPASRSGSSRCGRRGPS